MTNEEIRLNRYCMHCRSYDKGCDWLRRGMTCQAADAYEMALDEKDQQFMEYLDGKAIHAKEKRDADYLYGCDWDKWDDIYSAYMQIINELFNKE